MNTNPFRWGSRTFSRAWRVFQGLGKLGKGWERNYGIGRRAVYDYLIVSHRTLIFVLCILYVQKFFRI